MISYVPVNIKSSKDLRDLFDLYLLILHPRIEYGDLYNVMIYKIPRNFSKILVDTLDCLFQALHECSQYKIQ